MRKECEHKYAYKGACCCNCVNHYKDFSHPTTDGKQIEQKGWICIIPEMGEYNPEPIAFSGWSKHGFCELHQYKENK